MRVRDGTGWDSGDTERRRVLRCASQREDEARMKQINGLKSESSRREYEIE